MTKSVNQREECYFKIMEAFHTIKEQYRQIFLISHESEIKELPEDFEDDE